MISKACMSLGGWDITWKWHMHLSGLF